MIETFLYVSKSKNVHLRTNYESRSLIVNVKQVSKAIMLQLRCYNKIYNTVLSIQMSIFQMSYRRARKHFLMQRKFLKKLDIYHVA